MKRHHRFLADPRGYFTEPVVSRVEFSLTVITVIVVCLILTTKLYERQENEIRDMMVQDVTAARAEVLRLKAEIRRLKATETEPKRSTLFTSPSIKGSAEH